EAGAGRCGFLIASEGPAEAGGYVPTGTDAPTGADVVSGFSRTIPDGVLAMTSVVRGNGPFAGAIRHAIGDAGVTPSDAAAAVASRTTALQVATLDGDVFRGPHLVSGGGRAEARGILETKREIKELRERILSDRESLVRLAQETAELEGTIAHASNAIAALN